MSDDVSRSRSQNPDAETPQPRSHAARPPWELDGDGTVAGPADDEGRRADSGLKGPAEPVTRFALAEI
jgi:hypothetical protein